MAEEGVAVSMSAILSLILFVMFVMFMLLFIFPGFKNWLAQLITYIQVLVMTIINKLCPVCQYL